MKKILFTCLVCLWATTLTNAQMLDTTLTMNPQKVEAQSLFEKGKKQKTLGWILMGGGAGIVATAIIITLSDDPLSVFNEKKSTTRGVILVSGGVVMLSSIPFFIASGKNKRKANLMLINENVFFNPGLNLKEHLLAVGIKIHL